MDFNLPEELQILKQTVRRFVDQELIPIEKDSCEGNELKSEIRERLEKKTREMGLWLLTGWGLLFSGGPGHGRVSHNG